MTNDEACARATKPKNGGCDLLRPTKSPNRLLFCSIPTAEIDLTKWGVAMARKVRRISRNRVLNALDLTAFRAHIEARKRSNFREQSSAACLCAEFLKMSRSWMLLPNQKRLVPRRRLIVDTLQQSHLQS